MSNEPRYTFGNVDGIMKEGTGVSVGMDDNDRITITFKYRDADGKWWRAEANGWRTPVEEVVKHE